MLLDILPKVRFVCPGDLTESIQEVICPSIVRNIFFHERAINNQINH